MQRTAALDFGIDCGLEAHAASDHQASAGIAASRNRAWCTGWAREAIRVRSRTHAGDEAVSRYRLRAAGPGMGEVEVVRGGLRGAVLSESVVSGARECTS